MLPEWIETGLLIRGRASASTTLMRGWTYLSEQTIRELLGYSLQFVYPNIWPAIPVQDQFD